MKTMGQETEPRIRLPRPTRRALLTRLAAPVALAGVAFLARAVATKADDGIEISPARVGEFLKPTDFPERFIGDSELEFINLGQTRGLARGNETLFQNLLGIRDNYAEYPDIPRKVYTYDSAEQLQAMVNILPTSIKETVISWQWDIWARSVPKSDINGNLIERIKYPPTFKEGELRARVIADGSQEFHLSLPEARADMIPDPSQIAILNIIGNDERFPLFKILFSDPDVTFPQRDNLNRYLTDKYSPDSPIAGDPHLNTEIRIFTEDGSYKIDTGVFIVDKSIV